MIPAFTGRAAEYFVKERGRRRVVGRGPIAEGGRLFADSRGRKAESRFRFIV